MTYKRVIPRDLFNEGDLLKCLGRLALLTMNYSDIGFETGGRIYGGYPFEIYQDPSHGGISAPGLVFLIRGKRWDLHRPLNARTPWPLYATDPETENEVAVFDQDGGFTMEFRALLNGAPTGGADV